MDKYNFTENFQETVLALVIKDASTVLSFVDIIKPQYFGTPVLRFICSMLITFVRRYRESPTKTELYNFVRLNMSHQDKVPVEDIKKSLHRIFKQKIRNKDFILHEVVEFAKYSAMKEAIVDSADMLDDNDNRQKILYRIAQAQRVGIDQRNIGADIFRDRFHRMVQRTLRGVHENRLPTGLNTLDRAMFGGTDIGELWFFLGKPKGFKTGSLIQIGFTGLVYGKKVMHYTFEVSERNTLARYERRISGMTHDQITNYPKKFDRIMQRIENLGGELRVKEFPMRTASVYDVDSHLNYMQAEGFEPDLVIVDYADCMKPINNTDRRIQSADNFAGLRAIAQQRKTRVWTASQSNRPALSKKVMNEQDIAEAYEKAAICDGMIAICQTPEERAMKRERARYYIALSREGIEGITVYTELDKSVVRIRELKRYSANN